MPDAEVIKVADAVATDIGNHDWSQEATVERRYVQNVELSDLDTLYIDVAPGDAAIEEVTRAEAEHTCAVDVAVRKRFDTADEDTDTGEIKTASIDALVNLMQELHDFFYQDRVPSYDTAAWVKTDFQPLYYPAHLRELRQFTGVVRLTFQVVA